MRLSRIPQRPGWTAILLSWLAFRVAAWGSESCLECHEDQAKALGASVHAGLNCTKCHGGNPATDDYEAAHAGKAFAPLSDKRQLVEKCASCHSDVRMMNPYGLPSDQLERYKTSKHGEQLLQHGDQKVAACADCHGSHDILKVKSPQARTFPGNIPQTCGRCHADAKLMGAYQLPSDVLEKYKSSYHAHLLLEKGDLSAPTCVTCHGNHGATPPGTREVGQVCGKCHGRQAELFEKSPHAGLLASGKFHECISCHDNHAIQKASVELFSQCATCHADQAKPLAVRDNLVAVLKRSKSEFEQAGARVKEASTRGLATDEEELLLGEARTEVTQLEALQHTLTPDQLAPVAARSANTVGQINRGIEGLERVERWKRLALVPIWLFFIVMACLFWLKWKQLARRGRP